jgi:FMN reductase
MSLVVTISGSPGSSSRTSSLGERVSALLAAQGFEVQSINVRDLPATDLLHAVVDSPALQPALGLVERARGVVIATPIYKAAYTGVLKTFLDVLPQFGLKDKVVLPLATGGTLAHVLAIDYGLRPVLHSLGAHHVVPGLFVLDKLITRLADGRFELDAEIQTKLEALVDDFAHSLRRRHPPAPPSDEKK